MTFPRSMVTVAAVTTSALATLGWAATVDQQDAHRPAQSQTFQIAQATQEAPGVGMGMGDSAATPGHAEQLKAMRAMHDKVMAAKTHEERNALMTDQMKLMQNGMSMMGVMGAGAMMGKPGDMATRQSMQEQRMEMMQSMMQMMMDRMQSVPATK